MLTATWLRRYGSGVRNPRKNRTAHLDLLRDGLVAATAKYPITRFPDRRARSNPLAGSAPGIWDCRRIAASTERLPLRDPRPARFPARLSRLRLIVSSRFDKGWALTRILRNRSTCCLCASGLDELSTVTSSSQTAGVRRERGVALGAARREMAAATAGARKNPAATAGLLIWKYEIAD
jgi:hypothetical protein